jgi:hypothetical protein
MKRSLLFAFLFISLLTHAAPFPTTGSSLYLDTQKNLYLIPLGIALNLEKTAARMNLLSNEEERWVIQFPEDKQVFTMRYRLFSTDSDYEKSLKLWLREYQKSGLRIVQEKIGSKRPAKGWIHLEDNLGRQIFQFFTYRAPYWVYFGCAGERDQLDQLRSRCELLNSRLKFADELLDAPKRSTKKTR